MQEIKRRCDFNTNTIINQGEKKKRLLEFMEFMQIQRKQKAYTYTLTDWKLGVELDKRIQFGTVHNSSWMVFYFHVTHRIRVIYKRELWPTKGNPCPTPPWETVIETPLVGSLAYPPEEVQLNFPSSTLSHFSLLLTQKLAPTTKWSGKLAIIL